VFQRFVMYDSFTIEVALRGSGGMSLFGSVRVHSKVPAEYWQLYSTLERSLENFNAYLGYPNVHEKS
jgi:hypothetical protein